jgi:polyisoprenoid-binding protein YceI
MNRSFLVTFCILLFQTSIFSATLLVDSTQQNEVSFLANTTLGRIEGITSRISGYVKWEASDTLESSEVYFEVPLDSIDTGIGLRNRHMGQKYLETRKYPKAIFKGKLIAWNRDPTSPDTYLVSTKGVVLIHGVEKPMTLSGALTLQQQLLKATYFFSVYLPDFSIKKPGYLLIRVDETIHLKIDFYLKPE